MSLTCYFSPLVRAWSALGRGFFSRRCRRLRFALISEIDNLPYRAAAQPLDTRERVIFALAVGPPQLELYICLVPVIISVSPPLALSSSLPSLRSVCDIAGRSGLEVDISVYSAPAFSLSAQLTEGVYLSQVGPAR